MSGPTRGRSKRAPSVFSGVRGRSVHHHCPFQETEHMGNKCPGQRHSLQDARSHQGSRPQTQGNLGKYGLGACEMCGKQTQNPSVDSIQRSIYYSGFIIPHML